MATALPANLARLVLGTSGATVITVPTGQVWVITQVIMCHAKGTSPNQRVTLRVNNSTFVQAFLLPVGDTSFMDMKLVLEAGDTFQAASTTDTTVTLNVSGVKYVL